MTGIGDKEQGTVSDLWKNWRKLVCLPVLPTGQPCLQHPQDTISAEGFVLLFLFCFLLLSEPGVWPALRHRKEGLELDNQIHFQL